MNSHSYPKCIGPQDKQWLEYVKSKPQATIFHHPSWLKVLENSYGYRPFILVVRNIAGQITAGLPVMEIQRPLGGKRWVSLPFTDYCSPLYDNQEAHNQLIEHLLTAYQDHHTNSIQIRWELPSLLWIRSHTSHYLHTLPLRADSQAVLKGFKRTHRQNISTAEERGVVIKWGTEPEHLRLFYTMQLETRHRKGVPVQPWKFFELLGKEILDQGLGFILLAYKDSQCLAGGLFLYFQHTLTYKYAASIGEEQQLRPNNLLSWVAMQWGCDHGYTVFDLGRTELDNDGLRRFKCGWGASETPLPYSTISTSIASENNGKLVPIMQRMIRKAPPWFCRITGELLYRYFG